VPEMCAVVALLTTVVVIGKVAVVAPVGTVTLVGTTAALLSLAKVTIMPTPAGAGKVRVTVPVEPLPPATLVGLTVTEDKLGCGVSVKVACTLVLPSEAVM
jgi:hypothetical protein